jgi:hypothetical protein
VHRTVRFPFVTRLRSKMLLDHMDQDIELAPAADAGRVSQFLQAGSEIDRPYDDDDGGGCRVQQHAAVHVALLTFLLASLGWMWRPRRASAAARRGR